MKVCIGLKKSKARMGTLHAMTPAELRRLVKLYELTWVEA